MCSYIADKMQSFTIQETMKIVKFFDGLNNTPEYRFFKKNMMIAMKQHGDGMQHLEDMSKVYIKELLRLSCPVSTSVLSYQQKIDLG